MLREKCTYWNTKYNNIHDKNTKWDIVRSYLNKEPNSANEVLQEYICLNKFIEINNKMVSDKECNKSCLKLNNSKRVVLPIGKKLSQRIGSTIWSTEEPLMKNRTQLMKFSKNTSV